MIISDSIIHDIPPVSSNKPTLSLSIYISNAWRTNNPRVSIEFPYILSRKIPGFTDANLSPLPLFSKKERRRKKLIYAEKTNETGIEKRNEIFSINHGMDEGRGGKEMEILSSYKRVSVLLEFSRREPDRALANSRVLKENTVVSHTHTRKIFISAREKVYHITGHRVAANRFLQFHNLVADIPRNCTTNNDYDIIGL